MTRNGLSLVVAACLAYPAFAAKEYNIADFGAVADGRSDCAEAIQKALDTAGKHGGGRVVIPAADKPYLVRRTIRMSYSNVQLLGTGATLQLADNSIKGSNCHVLDVTGGSGQPITGVGVCGLTIDGNFWNQLPAHSCGRSRHYSAGAITAPDTATGFPCLAYRRSTFTATAAYKAAGGPPGP